MDQIYLDDLKLHDLNDGTCPFYVSTPIDGLEFPQLRVATNPKAGEDGITIPSIYLGERRIALRGKVDPPGGSAVDHLTYRKQIIAKASPIRTSGLLQTRTLRFADLDGNEYRLLVQVVNLTMGRDQVNHSTFMIDLLAEGSFIEAYTASTQAIETLTRGGFVLPVVLPIVFEAGQGGSATLINNGDAPAYPVITLDGPLTNPRILNETTGEYIALTITLNAGEQVIIDMAERTVVQGGVTNRLSTVSEDSTFFALQPGSNTLSLTTSVSEEAGTANVTWRHAYYGV